ncbi:MAG: ribonuclease III domain-containing protein, partial [Candidatus Thorarchaeota archaeon]
MVEQNRLSWDAINLEEKLNLLIEVVRGVESETPKRNTRMLRKTHRWISQLEDVANNLTRIRKNLAPKLERALHVSFKSIELLQVALFQPSTKNLFSEIEIQFSSEKKGILKEDDYRTLVSLSEIAKSLALVGDAAISIAVLHHIWQPKATDVGTLTQRRAEIVSNEHLAKVCDSWELYEQRIHFDPV